MVQCFFFVFCCFLFFSGLLFFVSCFAQSTDGGWGMGLDIQDGALDAGAWSATVGFHIGCIRAGRASTDKKAALVRWHWSENHAALWDIRHVHLFASLARLANDLHQHEHSKPLTSELQLFAFCQFQSFPFPWQWPLSAYAPSGSRYPLKSPA